ncbi:HNH endonuclease [Pararhodobacter aggregans]|uniref:Putative HNH nuclease YajD n=1 Tax=Pararhodobacter aggregans TaxID=404875 RepID=A0A2T7UQS1_9RHOB|nr:HNH endonuclease signature motif containing protein [Pararhodobacter aggregans]PTX01830.1 HNH endonuclease [Pararhodobacter aggregans]PVE47027.1 HNH endonuclease [Pararhodobacter aggregans]
MPSRAPRLCGCGFVVPHGTRCACEALRDAARKARFDKGRPSAAARGLGADWRRLRAEHLKKHPWCRRCGAKASDVDHIVPRRIAPERRLDPSNLQSLCKACHSGAKQREERHMKGTTP